MKKTKRKQKLGFTLVELLIVIVVIAILAAIGVVAYSGVQQRAVNAAVVSDLRHNIMKARQFVDINGRNPTDWGELVRGQFGGTATIEDSMIGTKREYFKNLPNPGSNNSFDLCFYGANGSPGSSFNIMLVAITPSSSVYSTSTTNMEVKDVTSVFNAYVQANGYTARPCQAILSSYGSNLVTGAIWYMQPYVRYNADCRCP